ncbi:MAG: spore coat U domain-containing protein [Geminicoccaceae bacterium]|nr:spore coat U domain-containing protein [Geminicoccaceae bacterium]MCS7269374.1 spore coat U domain-containing protein [Geminicoccaceae bacterium]MDW8340996.1 spore coat U domain-containing protein [Geminicoccaceae bacterium]
MSLSRASLLFAIGLFAALPARARCSLDVQPVVFGTIDLGRANYGKGAIIVRCDRPTVFEVAILGGGERELVAPRGGRLRYRLFSDPAHRRPWGDGGSGGATVSAHNDGRRPTRLTVYAVIPRQSGIVEGRYSDQLTVALRY